MTEDKGDKMNKSESKRSVVPLVSLGSSLLNEITGIEETMHCCRKEIGKISRLYESSLSTLLSEPKGQDLQSHIMQVRKKVTSDIENASTSIKAISLTSQPVKLQRDKLADLLKDLISHFQSVQNGYSKRYKEKLSRQYRLVNQAASDEDVAQLVHTSKKNAQVILQQHILNSKQNVHLYQTIEEAKLLHNELHAIEASLATLEDMAVDLSEVVEQQNQIIDTVGAGVQDVSGHLDLGSDQVDRKVLTKKSRKRWLLCCIITLVLAGGGTLLYFLVISRHFDKGKASPSSSSE
jgi:syntaxin 1B/2/3